MRVLCVVVTQPAHCLSCLVCLGDGGASAFGVRTPCVDVVVAICVAAIVACFWLVVVAHALLVGTPVGVVYVATVVAIVVVML